MTKSISFKELSKLIQSYKGKRIAITFHSIGDSDSVASAVALRNYLGNADIITPNFITNNARKMLKGLQKKVKVSNNFSKDAEKVIVLDANTLESLAEFKDKIEKFKGEVLFIDHHVAPVQSYKNATLYNDENYNSTSSIVYDLLKNLGSKTDSETARLLLNGIIADSADFQNASSLTFMQVSELLQIANISYQEILENFNERIPTDIKLKAIKDVLYSKIEVVGEHILMYGKATTHSNAVAERAIKLGADASVFWLFNKDEISISARLRSPLDKELSIHLGVLMQKIAPIIKGSGGGHPCAAGAYGPDKSSAETAINTLLSMVKERLT